MSVAEVQARISELHARLQTLAPQQVAYAATAARTSTSATSGAEFASNLQKAVAAQPLSPTSAAGQTAAVDSTEAEAVSATAKQQLGTPWASSLPVAGRKYVDEIAAAARTTGVDPRLLASVAWSESGFAPNAKSGAGAVGLMQLMPATARGLGVDPLDPGQALVGGGTYLAQQLQKFGGRVDLALAAYNAGPGAVRKHGGIPPYTETQTYVTRVLDRFQKLGGSV